MPSSYCLRYYLVTSGDVSGKFWVPKMELAVSEYFTVGNIFLAIVFLLILNQLVELYQFRNMPPGPRLTSLPFVGNLLSFASPKGAKQTEQICMLCFFASAVCVAEN